MFLQREQCSRDNPCLDIQTTRNHMGHIIQAASRSENTTNYIQSYAQQRQLLDQPNTVKVTATHSLPDRGFYRFFVGGSHKPAMRHGIITSKHTCNRRLAIMREGQAIRDGSDSGGCWRSKSGGGSAPACCRLYDEPISWVLYLTRILYSTDMP